MSRGSPVCTNSNPHHRPGDPLRFGGMARDVAACPGARRSAQAGLAPAVGRLT